MSATDPKVAPQISALGGVAKPPGDDPAAAAGG